MKKLQKATLIFSIIFFIACKNEINQDKLTEKKNEISKNKQKQFKDYIKSNIPQRINLNTDNIPEYIFSEMGFYIFFDGKTKKEIEYINPSGPKLAGNRDLKFIDINCNDNQKEFIVESAGGGTIGNYHYMNIMRYNSKTQKISSIFDYEISSFNWVDDEEKLDFVNYIDVLYSKDNECSDTIKIYKGKFTNKPESYSVRIKPQKLIEKYFFNRKTGFFEKDIN